MASQRSRICDRGLSSATDGGHGRNGGDQLELSLEEVVAFVAQSLAQVFASGARQATEALSNNLQFLEER